jgi:hypothetical protein
MIVISMEFVLIKYVNAWKVSLEKTVHTQLVQTNAHNTVSVKADNVIVMNSMMMSTVLTKYVQKIV